MRGLLDDLLDYSRASLGLGIPVLPANMDLAQVCEEEVELQRAAWPAHAIDLSSEGATHGSWDASRLKQIIANLVSNAAKYGDPFAAISVRVVGADNAVVLSVENTGPTISTAGVDALFEPLKRDAHGNEETERTSLGLGLFIVRHIAKAHGGSVSVASANHRTTFSVSLPRVV